MVTGDGGHSSARAWRAGRGAMRVHALSIFSLAVAFICLASALLVVSNIAAVRDRWSKAGRATVYLREGATETEVGAITAALEGTAGVKKVRFVSSVEARREIVTDDHDRALAQLPAAAFPASLEVSFGEEITDDALRATALKLRALPAVESVETYQRWTERLSSLLSGGVTASAVLSIVVLCAVVSVIGSTMRLLLHRRRAEVEVLKLVGATDAFVRRPFVVEGAAQGAAGAGAALLLLGVIFLVVRGHFDQDLFGVAPSFLPWPLALGMIALGGGLGAATALVSLRKMVRI